MVARIPSRSRPRVKPTTGMRLFCSVISKRFRASIPPVNRTSMVLRDTPVADCVAVSAGLRAIFFDHLVDAHARGDHRVDVSLRVDMEVQDGAAFLSLRPPHRPLHVVTLADRAEVAVVEDGDLYV